MTAFDCPELAGVRVLVVDDDDDNREMLATVLAQSGAVVLMASSAAEALRVFEREAPRILLSDIGLPAEDGFDLLRQVRALEAVRGGASIRAVALSGYGSDQDRRRAKDGGFDAHFTKPIPLRALLDTVRSLLS